MVEPGVVDPAQLLSQVEPMADVIEARSQFDLRRPGWIKVELRPAA
jgi:threonine dehydrogenase-like Zn-dependent dehydrogenase